jgi:bacteriocin-like protein
MKSHVPLFTDKVSVKFNPKINPKMNEYKTLNNNEMQEIQGGLGFLTTVAAGIIIGAAINVMNNWDDFKAGVTEGINNR